ncbi:MAG: M48 family metallopeptidase [Synechococcales cyanobacterium RU_4_20]|nr:M48 family metallopeptidase [Synechococcales cyanobacterium RU_4_20]NJR67937.1 M48 family metallopeptidase [Synechococcales cyanobacterium CRU_2_2]
MPQPYSVRESKRAKYVSLRISSVGRLEVVVPLGFDRATIPRIVAKKQSWIDRVQQKLAQHPTQQDQGLSGPFPNRLELAALGQTWQVEYCPTQSLDVAPSVYPQQHLRLLGAVDNWFLCQTELKHWLVSQAKRQLIPRLEALSQETGLSYAGVSVRSPKTRWGSCSATHSINLNSKLLFLSPELVRYVLIHELCHTVHFNHSREFWSLVGNFEPHYLDLRQALRAGHHQVPHWME